MLATFRLAPDVAYDRALHHLKTRPMIVPPPLSQKAKVEAIGDFYASVRTNVLLAWVLSNVGDIFGMFVDWSEKLG